MHGRKARGQMGACQMLGGVASRLQQTLRLVAAGRLSPFLADLRFPFDDLLLDRNAFYRRSQYPERQGLRRGGGSVLDIETQQRFDIGEQT
jgi:hypothetical protein